MAKIAIDIDSTLHHYWPLLQRIARERFGVDLPYEEQRTWEIAELEREQLVECVLESHSDENILAGEPYPESVETVRAWHDAGHFIHITSHRSAEALEATGRWLREIGIPHHDLHCSYDKIARCVELGIDVLVDDSPVNLTRGRDAGMLVATLRHPWNQHLAADPGVVVAEDWRELREKLAHTLGG